MKKYGVIYKTINTVNGKIYIGQDSNNRPRYLGSGLLIKKAIKKYGRDKFIKEVLEECLIEDLGIRERYYIELFNSMDLNIGYNLRPGGNHVHDYSQSFIDKMKRPKTEEWKAKKRGMKVHSQEFKDAVSKRFKGKKYTAEKLERVKIINQNPERNAKISLALKGRKLSDETKLKLSEKAKERELTKLTCPYCGNMSSISNAKRWHFDNCKYFRM
jgi:group I intron endonuclease